MRYKLRPSDLIHFDFQKIIHIFGTSCDIFATSLTIMGNNIDYRNKGMDFSQIMIIKESYQNYWNMNFPEYLLNKAICFAVVIISAIHIPCMAQNELRCEECRNCMDWDSISNMYIHELNCLEFLPVYISNDTVANKRGYNYEFFYKDLNNNFRFPKTNEQDEMPSTSYLLEFVIGSDGRIYGARVSSRVKRNERLETEIGDSIIKAVSDFRWIPGIRDGKKVNTMIHFPIRYEFRDWYSRLR